MEMVNHPAHYKSTCGEVIDIIESWGLGFCLGNALKYICRAGKKDGAKRETDLEKALFYIRRAKYDGEYCGPGTYKLESHYLDEVHGEVLPLPRDVANGFSLSMNLEIAVNKLYEFVITFDRDCLDHIENYISNELNGGKEHE